MSNPTLEALYERWADALWAELNLAYERDHMDASHDIATAHQNTVDLGPDAYRSWLYNAPNGNRYTWMDKPVDDLSWETEFAALVYMTARDHGLDAAMLMKLSHVKGDRL